MRHASSFLFMFSWIAVTSTTIDLDTTDQYRCTFDAGVCGCGIEGPVHNGPGYCDHGWPDDAVGGVTAVGAYMCFFLEHLPVMYPGLNRARLTSPTINTNRSAMISFAVGTVRPPTGTYLNVLLVMMNGTESLLWSTSDLLSPWQRVQVGVVKPGPYKIVIEGIPNPPFLPNFGIDNFTITATDFDTSTVLTTSGKSETTRMTKVPTTKTTGTPPSTTHQEGTTSDISVNSTPKATSYFPRSTLKDETTKRVTPSKTISTMSNLEKEPTKSAQRGEGGVASAQTVPIAVGTTGGFLVVAIGAFTLWKKYARKPVVSPETYTQDNPLNI
ncbi:uncharacterized protein LOC144862003 [Branchiostoma floridae x Branchiostoma japonicum]